eukprot:12629157-Ditylum_brightwellii.AAC.1
MFLVAVAYPTTITNDTQRDINKRPHQIQFDTDSFLIGVDNHASCCIDPNLNHFVDGMISEWPKGVKRPAIKGFQGGCLVIAKRGTFRWPIENDLGHVTVHLVSDTAYVPNTPYAILLPQHWAHQTKDNKPKPHGTWCVTYADRCVLQWHQRKHHCTILYDP